jgi:hypothetical protein
VHRVTGKRHQLRERSVEHRTQRGLGDVLLRHARMHI